jgi:hypothetical protein
MAFYPTCDGKEARTRGTLSDICGTGLTWCRSFSDSHIRIEDDGWTRQTTVRELGASADIAGVNMRLGPGVIRELHWHKEAEWAYVLAGQSQVYDNVTPSNGN